jgi:signal recognition particle subunit SRP54
MAGKLAAGDSFTLEDFVEQLAMVRKLGPIGNLLGMLPGAAQNRELLSQVSDKDLDRAAAIVNSMTVAERRSPRMINGSRRARIAAGSGVTVGEVNNLVVRFLEAQKMMRQMMGGLGGMGVRRAQKARAKGKKKGKGGGARAGASRPAGQVGPAVPGQLAGQLPAGLGRGLPGSGPGGFSGLADDGDGALAPGSDGGAARPGLPAAFGGPQSLPPGLRGPQQKLPPGLRAQQPNQQRGPVPSRRGRTGKKGR